MNDAVVVLLAGLGSYGLRASMVVVAAHAGVPAVFGRVGRQTVPVAFAALAASALTSVRPGDHPGPAAAVISVVVAVAAVRALRSPLVALPVGLPLLWILTTVNR